MRRVVQEGRPMISAVQQGRSCRSKPSIHIRERNRDTFGIAIAAILMVRFGVENQAQMRFGEASSHSFTPWIQSAGPIMMNLHVVSGQAKHHIGRNHHLNKY